MGSMAAEEVPPSILEELCLLPAGLLVAERRSNFGSNRQQDFKLRKCVTNICEAAPVHFKYFIRKKAGKNLKVS